MELEFQNVTKFYGPVIGVNDVSCRFAPGITGLLGANGAGKSTMLKLASGQLRASAGRVSIGGEPATRSSAKRSFGYCPDGNRMYEDMTVGEFVFFMTALYGYSRRESAERASAALAEVGMTALVDRKLAGASHGMRQRARLAQALVNDPPVLLLDEPLSGIDPRGRREINELLVKLAGAGKTIVVSSHILHEVESLADRLVMLVHGRLAARGSLEEIRALLSHEPLHVAVGCNRCRELAARLIELDCVQEVEVQLDDPPAGTALVRTTRPEQFFAELNALAAGGVFELARLETLDAGVEAVFGYLQQVAP